METHLSNFEIMQSSRQRRSNHRHTTQSGLHSEKIHCTIVRSEDNLAPRCEKIHCTIVSSGASSSQYLHDVRDGDRPDTVRAPEPHGGKDVSVCYVTWTIDSTRECAALYDVHDFFWTSIVTSLGYTATRGRFRNRETRKRLPIDGYLVD